MSKRPAVDDYPGTAGYRLVEPSHLAENIAKLCANSFGEELFGEWAMFIEGKCFWVRTVKGDGREMSLSLSAETGRRVHEMGELMEIEGVPETRPDNIHIYTPSEVMRYTYIIHQILKIEKFTPT